MRFDTSPDPQRSSSSHLPIGVFDSGIGGLTVAGAIRRRLPGESILYFGDTARVPYGTKSAETIRRYTTEIVHFFATQRVKMIVAACNSCSANAMDCVERDFGGPCLGVIGPGAEKALEVSQNRRIGVIGTRATIHSGAYEKALMDLDAGTRVFSTACPLFVPLAEERLEDHAATRLIATDYLQPLLDQGIDTLILGCTHYPLLKKTLQEIVGPEVSVVDSAESTAEKVAAVLKRKGLLREEETPAELRAFVSDDPERVGQFLERLMWNERVWVGTAQPETGEIPIAGQKSR